MARCSPTTRWHARGAGAVMTTRSATGTKTPATKRPIWQGSSLRTAVTEKRDETWHPSRLPSGGVPGRHHRCLLSYPLDDHLFKNRRVGDSDGRANLPAGGG